MTIGGHPGVPSVQGGILADYDQNFSHWLDYPDAKFQLPQRAENYLPLTLYVGILFWANALRTHIDWPGVTSVQGGMLAEYDQIDTHVLKSTPANFGHPKSLDPILTDVVSRQFGAPFWLITTKLIHMSWSEILPSLVILRLFTFDLHVICYSFETPL